jgi:hypothetical protein
MSTITTIIKHYIKKFKAKAIMYSPSKKSDEEDFGTQRDNLYKAFISKALPGVKFEKNSNFIIAILPDTINELVTDTEVICDNCGWEWKIEDGGDDLYTCHKCGHDNNPDLDEASDPQAGTALPYGSGFAPIKESYQFKVLDKNYDEEDNSLISVDYNFSTPNNDYRVEFNSGEYNPESKKFDVSFGLDKGYGFKLDTFQMTGEGNALSILKTIIDIIKDFTNRFEVNKLVINPTSEKRGKIYSMILKSLSPDILSKVELINENDIFGLNELAKDFVKEVFDKAWNLQEGMLSLSKYMIDNGMNIKPLPKIKVIKDDEENASNLLGKTAYYNPVEKSITLFTMNRHPKDILRSFAHEMIHHEQNLNGKLNNITTQNTNEDGDLPEIEKEAYEKGNMMLRNWEDSIKNV